MNRTVRYLIIASLLLLFLAVPFLHTSQTRVHAVPGVYDEHVGQVEQSVSKNKELNMAGSAWAYSQYNMIGTINEIVGVGNAPGINGPDLKPGQVMQYNPDSFKHSALGSMTDVGLTMYANPPANLALWINDTGQTLGFIRKPVYAQGAGAVQGLGFSGLSGLLPIWKVFRNIAYFLLAVAMIIIGFMVMLRQKIDPKTVVTVQNALPRIVITLLLITFSYAIVGLMIDLMYLVLFLITGMLKSAGNQIVPGLFDDQIPSAFVTSGTNQIWYWLFPINGFKVFENIFYFLSPATKTAPLAADVASKLSGTAAAWTQSIFGGIGSIVVTLIVAILLLIAFFRILAMLIMAYLQVILAVIIAPLQLLLDAFPGGEGFAGWIKNLVSNLLVFPITAALFMITAILAAATGGGSPARIWSPPLIYPGGAYALTGIISIGMLLAIPKIVGSIKEALKAQPAVQLGINVGGGFNTFSQLLSTYYYARQIVPDSWKKALGMAPPGGGGGPHQSGG